MADRPRLRVLIVEDDSTSRLVLRGILETLDGLEIFEAGRGVRLLGLTEAGKICVAHLSRP